MTLVHSGHSGSTPLYLQIQQSGLAYLLLINPLRELDSITIAIKSNKQMNKKVLKMVPKIYLLFPTEKVWIYKLQSSGSAHH